MCCSVLQSVAVYRHVLQCGAPYEYSAHEYLSHRLHLYLYVCACQCMCVCVYV